MVDDWNAIIQGLCDQIAELQAQVAAPAPQAERKFNKKVEVIADPSKWNGERQKFNEWWMKIKVWLRANEDAFENDFEACTVVWSRMTGPSAGRYTETRMAECYDSGAYPGVNALIVEVQEFFSPQTEKDWAKTQIQNTKQGRARIDDFIARWLSLFRQSKISDVHGVYLLEKNTSSRIIQQIFNQGLRKNTVPETLKVIQAVGGAQEMYDL